MTIDYKKELEAAARTMILVHEPELLIKMIARTVVQKVRVSHMGILLRQMDGDSYVMNVSSGPLGIKIPAGFARMDIDNPLIRFFREGHDKVIFNDGAITKDKITSFLNSNSDNKHKEILLMTQNQMKIFESEVCIPCYFRNDLLGLLLLGKKNDGRKFTQEELDFFIALTSDVAMAIRNAQLFQKIELELDKRNRLFIHTTIAFASAIEAKDHYTHGHTNRVTSLCLEIAKCMGQKEKKFSDKLFLENLHIASLLHDIGKIGIPEAILNKTEPLSKEEWMKIKEHPLIGVNILQPIKELQEPILGIKYHHERFDGSGYPEGLKGEQIPWIASIISVADAFDAMITTRVYRKALSKEDALNEIWQLSGKQFHPEVVGAFVELYGEGKIV